jgi:hypothetical protein
MRFGKVELYYGLPGDSNNREISAPKRGSDSIHERGDYLIQILPSMNLIEAKLDVIESF